MNILISIKTDATELLIHAAEKLLADYGFDRTSVRIIAGMAGLNLALIGYYFSSKLELLKAAFQFGLQQLSLVLTGSTAAGSIPDNLITNL